MSEQRDNTTNGGEPSPARSEPRQPGSYYDDDATGYEVYDPSKDDDEEIDERDEPAGNEDDVIR